MVNATTGTNNTTAANANTTANAQTGLNKDFNQFLNLLTTELKNQDPTTPLDTNQITQQIASLSQVQQALNTNNKLDQLLSYFSASQANQAVSYIGKQIDATGNQIDLSASAGAVVYTLPAGAQSATVTVQDSTGATIFTSEGTTNEGRNQLLWNGLNSTTKATMPDGIYTFKVTAKDAAGKDVNPTTYTSGVVTAVNTQNGTNSLSLGKINVPISTVQSIYTAGTNPNA